MAWYPVTVRHRVARDNGLFTFSLEAPAGLLRSFQAAGQYHRIMVEQVGESFFAPASSPAESARRGRVDYLARSGSAVANGLVDGASVSVSELMGAGFPLQLANDRHLVLVATGTGIAPIRSVLASWAEHPKARTVDLVYGVREQSEFSFGHDFETWAALGLRAHLTLSRHHPGWHGEVGRVQQRAAALALPNPRETVVFICGQSQMEHEVSDVLRQKGVPAEHIVVNH